MTEGVSGRLGLSLYPKGKEAGEEGEGIEDGDVGESGERHGFRGGSEEQQQHGGRHVDQTHHCNQGRKWHYGRK